MSGKRGVPTIREIGEEARRIDPEAFTVCIRRDTPNRNEWETRQGAALAKARKNLSRYRPPADQS
jgi:hypothetical protein